MLLFRIPDEAAGEADFGLFDVEEPEGDENGQVMSQNPLSNDLQNAWNPQGLVEVRHDTAIFLSGCAAKNDDNNVDDEAGEGADDEDDVLVAHGGNLALLHQLPQLGVADDGHQPQHQDHQHEARLGQQQREHASQIITYICTNIVSLLASSLIIRNGTISRKNTALMNRQNLSSLTQTSSNLRQLMGVSAESRCSSPEICWKNKMILYILGQRHGYQLQGISTRMVCTRNDPQMSTTNTPFEQEESSVLLAQSWSVLPQKRRYRIQDMTTLQRNTELAVMAQRKITKQTRLAVLVSTPNLRALRYYRAALPTSSTPRARIPSATMASAGCRMYKQQKRSPWSSGNCCVGPDIVSIIMIDKLQASPAMVADCNTSANIIFNNKSTGMSLASFDILEKLGQGSFAKVYKVRRHSDQKIYALKQVYLNKLDQKSKLNALNQIRLLASFDCGAIVKYYEAFIDDREGLLCIVMEYADEGDLKALIEAKRHKGEKFYQMQIWKVLVSLVKGLVYLHARSIIHRDIKPDNILSADGQFKIGDLNVSCVQQNSLQKLTQIGTPFYASPEIWSNQPYDHKCDIWSLGCVIYQMATLSLPFPSTSMDKLFIEVTKAKPKPIPKHYSNELCHIIDICLQKSRDKRPSAQELLDNFTVKMYDNLFYCGEQKKAQDYARLLKTIKFPTNKNINEIELPAANYEAPPQPKTGREINIEEDLTKVEPGSQHFMMDLFSNQTPKNTQDLPGNFEQESRQQKKNGIIPTAEKIKGAHSILTINPEVGQELNVKESLRIEKRSIHKSHILIPVTIMKEANPYPKASSQKEIQSELPVRHNNGGVTLKSIDQKRCLDTKQNSQHASLNKRANQTEQKSRTRKSSPRTQLSAKKLQTVACAYEGILMKKLKEGGRRMSACQNLGQNWVLTEGNDFRHKIQEKLQKRHSMKQQGSKKQLQKRSVNIIAEVSNQTRPRTQQSSILNEARQSKANKQRKNRGKLFETELEACISNTDLMKRIKNLHKAIVF